METAKPIVSQNRLAFTSASNAEADSRCPGRHQAQLKFPEEETRDSAYGSRVHDALAKGNDAGLSPDAQSTYLACNAIVEKLLPQVFGEEIKKLLAVPNREQRFWIKWADGLQHSGQLDAVYRKGTKALIIEYKSLAGELPESSRNMQLRDQAVLYDFNCPMLSEVAVAVVQPLVTHSPEICVYTREHLARARDELYARVRASNDPNAPRKAGEAQCKWCRARNGCPEYAAWAGKEIAAAPEAESLLDKPVMMWTPAERVMYLDRARIVKKWLETCDEAMKAALKADPNAIPGYELKPGAVKSLIINPQAVFDSFSKAGGTLEQFMECVGITKTKLVVAVREVTQTKGKKLDEAVEGIIGENVQKSQNEPSIVRKDA